MFIYLYMYVNIYLFLYLLYIFVYLHIYSFFYLFISVITLLTSVDKIKRYYPLYLLHIHLYFMSCNNFLYYELSVRNMMFRFGKRVFFASRCGYTYI